MSNHEFHQLLQNVNLGNEKGAAPTQDGATATSSSSVVATDAREPVPNFDIRHLLMDAENRVHLAIQNAKFSFHGNMEVLRILEVALTQLSSPSNRTALNSLLTIQDATVIADFWQSAKTNKDSIKDARHAMCEILVWRCQCHTKHLDDRRQFIETLTEF